MIEISVKKLINKYGRQVRIKRREEIVDNDGNVKYRFPKVESIKGMFMQLTGYEGIFERIGIPYDVDFLGVILPNVTVKIGDLINIDDDWYKVQRIINRYLGSKIVYKEILLRRVQ